jgi:hypothetical protein
MGRNSKWRTNKLRFIAYGKNLSITMRWFSMLCSHEILKGSVLPQAKKRHFELHPLKCYFFEKATQTQTTFYERLRQKPQLCASRQTAVLCRQLEKMRHSELIHPLKCYFLPKATQPTFYERPRQKTQFCPSQQTTVLCRQLEKVRHSELIDHLKCYFLRRRPKPKPLL